MQTITPHLWFDTQAKEAAEWYAGIFPNSRINHVTQIEGTPSGNAEIVTFTLAGVDFTAISAGPYFTFNPSISFFATFATAEEIDAAWQSLSEGATVLMPYQEYPWAQKYGWLSDRYGLSWQLSMSTHHQFGQPITPALLFTGANAGRSKEAIEAYTAVFPDSKIEAAVPYAEGDGDTPGFLKHARFSLLGRQFIAMDSSHAHAFTFNEAVSLLVACDTQEEIDRYWDALSRVPEAEQCGWLKDQFGVSWQIAPSSLDAMLRNPDPGVRQRVTGAFLGMKKFDIATLEAAARGE